MIYYLIATFILYMWKEISNAEFFKHNALMGLFLLNLCVLNSSSEYVYLPLCAIVIIMIFRILVDIGAIRYQELERRKGRSGTLLPGSQRAFIWWQNRQVKIYRLTYILLASSFVVYILE